MCVCNVFLLEGARARERETSEMITKSMVARGVREICVRKASTYAAAGISL